MHRLVQAVLFDSMEEQERELWDLRVTKTLDAVFPESGPAAWEQCERLLLHVLTCLDRTGATTARLEAASLATKAANYLRARALCGSGAALPAGARHPGAGAGSGAS